MTINSITIEPGGYVPKTALVHFSIPDWSIWLLARLQDYDALTGKTLIGLPDRYGVIRESILRALGDENTQIVSRFADAVWMVIRETIVSVVESIPSNGSMQTQLVTLSELLRLLTSLPSEVASAAAGLEKSIDRLKKFSLQHTDVQDRNLLDSVRSSAINLLDHLNVPLDSQFEALLKESNLAGNIAIPLLRQRPQNAAAMLGRIYCTLSLAGRAFDFNNVLEIVEYAIKNKSIQTNCSVQQLLMDARNHIESRHLMAFDTEREVTRILGESVALTWIRKKRQIRFVDEKYVPRWEVSHGVAEELSDCIVSLIHDSDGVYYSAHTDDRGAPWNYLLEEIACGQCICRAPVFLTSHRAKSKISVVPFGCAKNLAIAYVCRNAAGPIHTQVRTFSRLSDISRIRRDVEIATMGGTAADTELRLLEEDEIRHSEYQRHFLIEDLENWLFKMRDDKNNRDDPYLPRIAVVDIGFAQELKKRFLNGTVSQSLLGYDCLYQPVTYPKPILIGIAVPSSDYRWGMLIRTVVRKVIYGKHNILAENSAVAATLQSIGIEPLSSKLLNELSPAVEVPRHLLPFVDSEEQNKDGASRVSA